MHKARKPKKPRKPERKLERPLAGLFETASELGCSINTARRYALNGKLPSVRIAGKIFIPREAILRAQREGI
jgi:hypothetical protein